MKSFIAQLQFLQRNLTQDYLSCHSTHFLYALWNVCAIDTIYAAYNLILREPVHCPEPLLQRDVTQDYFSRHRIQHTFYTCIMKWICKKYNERLHCPEATFTKEFNAKLVKPPSQFTGGFGNLGMVDPSVTLSIVDIGFDGVGGIRLNIKMLCLSVYDSHYKDKTVSRPSYLYNGNPYIWEDILYIERDPVSKRGHLFLKHTGRAIWRISAF